MSVCPVHPGAERFDLSGCAVCLKRAANLLDRDGSRSDADRLTETERSFIGLEPKVNGRREPRPKRVMDLAEVMAAFERREIDELARYDGAERE